MLRSELGADTKLALSHTSRICGGLGMNLADSFRGEALQTWTGRFVHLTAALTSDRVALLGVRIPQVVSVLTARLQEAGVVAGDRVFVLGPVDPGTLAACWATRAASATPVPIPSYPSAADLLPALREGRPVATCAPQRSASALNAITDPQGRTLPVVTLDDSQLISSTPLSVLIDARRQAGRKIICVGDATDLMLFADVCLAALAQGRWVHCLPPGGGPELLNVVAEHSADTLLASPRQLRMLRRSIEAELAAAPVVMLALFEAVQADPGLTAEARRAWMEPLHSRFGAQLRAVQHVGGPMDEETTSFFTRLGISVEPADTSTETA